MANPSRWKRILALFAWKPRWAVYGRYAYVWEPVAYKPEPITFDWERRPYGELHPHTSYSYAGLVVNTNPAVVSVQIS